MDSYSGDHNVRQQLAGPQDKNGSATEDSVVAERQAVEGGVVATWRAKGSGSMASQHNAEGSAMVNQRIADGDVIASQHALESDIMTDRLAATEDGIMANQQATGPDAGEHERQHDSEPPSREAIPSPEKHRVPALAPQEVLLDAACAFDSLARYVTAGNFDQLSKTQADAVMRIALFGPASMTELASGLGVSKEHVTRAVADLEEQGLVTKRRNTENRRIVEAVLTGKGEEAVTAIRLASIERLEKPLSSLSPAERDELVDLSTRAVSLLLKIRLG